MNDTMEGKVKRTNREALNAMTNEQFAKFMHHIDCSMCAYYSDMNTVPGYVCAKHHERELAEYSNDYEEASRICIDGIAKWLDQEEAWFMKE